MDCVWEAEKEWGARDDPRGVLNNYGDGSHRVSKEMGLLWQGQPMDEVPGMACEAIKDLEDERVTTCPRRSASWYFAF
eukprot:6213953-Pleurochrysis_carterae.AAC.3